MSAAPMGSGVSVETAVSAARAAAPAAHRASGPERAGWLRAIADALDAARSELVGLADGETHLGSPRLPGELARTTSQLRLFASVIEEGSYLEAVVDHADATTTPPRPDLRRLLVPIGPVAVYAASNFPFAFSVAGGDTASALAVGCPVVVKAHPGHAVTSRRVAEIVTEALAGAGAPVGLFGMVEGYQEGIDLVEHPGITAAAFTGSVAGGRALADRAAARPVPIPFFGELGSINPVVVTAAADAARGAELATGLAASFTLGAGQFCTKPGIVFVPAGSALEAALPEAVTAPTATMLTESIAEGFVRGVRALEEVPGVETLVASSGAGDPGLYAVDAATFVDRHEVLGTEVFGPATLLVRCADPAELLAAVGSLEGSLTATLHSEAEDDVDEVLAALVERSGRVLFAGWPTGVAVSWAQQHGGPWPATTSQHTSVGATATRRFQRPVAFQDAPERLLPEALREGNPLNVPRRVDGVFVPAS